MQAVKCDRCGWISTETKIVVKLKRVNFDGSAGFTEQIDLCQDCAHAFHTWMEKVEKRRQEKAARIKSDEEETSWR